MSNEHARTYTLQLSELLEKIEKLYETTKATKKEYDFYKDIEPFVKEVEKLALKWSEAVRVELKQRDIHYFSEVHIEQVVDNMCNLSVQAFQHTASYKRFKDYHQSTKFLLTSLCRQLA